MFRVHVFPCHISIVYDKRGIMQKFICILKRFWSDTDMMFLLCEGDKPFKNSVATIILDFPVYELKLKSNVSRLVDTGCWIFYRHSCGPDKASGQPQVLFVRRRKNAKSCCLKLNFFLFTPYSERQDI